MTIENKAKEFFLVRKDLLQALNPPRTPYRVKQSPLFCLHCSGYKVQLIRACDCAFYKLKRISGWAIAPAANHQTSPIRWGNTENRIILTLRKSRTDHLQYNKFVWIALNGTADEEKKLKRKPNEAMGKKKIY